MTISGRQNTKSKIWIDPTLISFQLKYLKQENHEKLLQNFHVVIELSRTDTRADPRNQTGIKLEVVEIFLTLESKMAAAQTSPASVEEMKLNKTTKYKLRIRVFAFYWGAFETD